LVLENRVGLRRDAETIEFLRGIGVFSDLNTGHVVDVAVVITVAQHTKSDIALLPFDLTDMRHESLPLHGHLGARCVVVASFDANNEHCVSFFKSGFCNFHSFFGHTYGLHKFDVLERAGLADRIRRDAKLIFESTGERFVRAISGLDCYIENTVGSIDQFLGRFGQPSAANVAHDGLPRAGSKRTNEMKLGQTSGIGHFVKRKLTLEVRLNIPE